MIKSHSLRECRLEMKAFSGNDYQRSSVYILDDDFYVVVGCSHLPQIKFNQVLMCLGDGVNYNPAEYKYNEFMLIAWATSEIEQTLQWIKYEHESHLIENEGRKYGAVLRSFKSLTETMAIINYTPDSFSDGGDFYNIENACKQIIAQVNFGASIIDLGVESTRPNAVALSFEQEMKILDEILPEILALKRDYGFKLSIDTYHSENVARLIALGVDIINDVSGCLNHDALCAIRDSRQIYVAMHSLSVPVKRELTIPLGTNPIELIHTWMSNKLEQLLSQGFSREQIILDPGIGFGTNPAQAWYILRHINQLCQLPCEILVGHSRKSLFTHFSNISVAERDPMTNFVSCYLANNGVDYLRLHNVELFHSHILRF